MRNRADGPTLDNFYGDRLMSDLTEEDNEVLFAHMTEKVATRCRRTFSALHDDHIKPLHLAVDALAYIWHPDLTARPWLAAAGEDLGIETTGLLTSDRPRLIMD